MFEITVPHELSGMKAAIRHTMRRFVFPLIGLGIAVMAAGIWLEGIAGICLGLAGGFFLAYPLFFYFHFPRRLLREHRQIAPEAKYTFDANRVMCISGAAIWTWGWDEIIRVVWTDRYAVLLCQSGEALPLPRTAINGCEGLEAFLRQQNR